jgi:hypothetical protein
MRGRCNPWCNTLSYLSIEGADREVRLAGETISALSPVKTFSTACENGPGGFEPASTTWTEYRVATYTTGPPLKSS